MTSSKLLEMLNKHQMVYIKPDIGTYGAGVMRVETERAGNRIHYICRQGKNRHTFKAYGDLYYYLLKKTKNRKYLVQKGINLLKHNQRSFDLRVMVKKIGKSEWKTMGMLGRVAQQGKVVTNYHSGGTLKKIDVLLEPYIQKGEREQFKKRLARLGEEAAKQLQPHFPALTSIGLDVGLGKELHPWILEVNFRPDPYIFRKVGEHRVFRNIMKYRHRRLKRKKTG